MVQKRRSIEESTGSMHEDRYPRGNLGKIEVSGNARFLWYLGHFGGRNGKGQDLLSDA
jgi:hypothetical protein